MLQTKKMLKQRIRDLESELKEARHHILRSALVDAADLPQCKSKACYNCKYITFMYHPTNGAMYLLGCGKELACEDFEFTDANKPDWEARKEWLLWRLQVQFPSQSSTLCDSCVHAPLPPCHEEES